MPASPDLRSVSFFLYGPVLPLRTSDPVAICRAVPCLPFTHTHLLRPTIHNSDPPGDGHRYQLFNTRILLPLLDDPDKHTETADLHPVPLIGRMRDAAYV